MKSINFSKLNGQGNDFVFIDSFSRDIKLTEKQIAFICDRHFGIGADGLIIVRKSKNADFFMDYYNMDGSFAEMCGNGIRCMAKFIYDKGMIDKKEFDIDTRAGIKIIKVSLGKDGSVQNASVNMGLPVFEPLKIPVKLEENSTYKDKRILEFDLSVKDCIFKINCVSMGNPHCVIFLGEREDLKKYPVNEIGPEIENHNFFPNKTNVEFVKIKNDSEIDMRVWERGVGETLACGTGACASSVISMVLGKVTGPELKVNLPGGVLSISWTDKSAGVFLKGSVQHSFNGKYFID